MVILHWIEIFLLTYFIYIAGYTLIFAIAGLLYKNQSGGKLKIHLNRFGVFIPAYKEDQVILEIAKSSLNQEYSSDLFSIIVIADSLQESTLKKLKALPIKVIDVAFEKSTKVKALNLAFSKFDNEFDYAVILDADNIMDKNFISSMNLLHQKGYNAIQGRRAAKNTNNTLSFLDGLSEEINTHIFCKGSSFLKISSILKGSGMSFDFMKLKKLLSEMDSVGGFDKELELKFLDIGDRVQYMHTAVIFDEKVEESQTFENQRRRWIKSQFFYLQKYFVKGIKNLFRGRFTYFNSAILRNVQLPRLLSYGILFVLTISSLLIKNQFQVYSNIWLLTLIITTISIILAIPREYYSIRLFISIFLLPKIFWKMFVLLFKMRGANKVFIHTPHNLSDKEKK